ncbi:hypothetical protein EV356DRAFT_54811 [Viridothelium virens]|uniref:GDS1 winged helix domain-containing protein n=1 Tax=Viridothelium virens TaxID=1048519 RepID=A0A6A6HG17_VIRVR|nr:hypothetical protein EV356DRAFT_54811 [Viridothelium virens]
MPYNTRRKSLSLPSLGIHVPKASSNRSPPTSVTPASEQPPAKRAKRSHSSTSNSPRPMSPPTKATPGRPKSAGKPMEHTPPPSPGATGNAKIDTDGIQDDIVIAVIEQLEKTGNRPHLVKELAAVLANNISAVESSSNPSAIITSRLTSYLRREWTALAPCPLAKELVGTHPKRTYFYLTTSPHQDLPEFTAAITSQSRIISPSLSSGSNNNISKDETMSDEDGAASDTSRHERAALSPSPEVDFSCPELDGDDSSSTSLTPGGNFSGRNSVASESHRSNGAGNSARQPPPLERDEREFTQTAAEVRRRRRSEATAANSASRSSVSSTASKSTSASAASSVSPPPQNANDDDDTVDSLGDDAGVKATEELGMEILKEPPFIPDFNLEGLDQDAISGMSNSEAAAELFAHHHFSAMHPHTVESTAFGSEQIEDVDMDDEDGDDEKPFFDDLAVKPQKLRVDLNHAKATAQEDLWSDLKSPENVDMDELEALLEEQEDTIV